MNIPQDAPRTDSHDEPVPSAAEADAPTAPAAPTEPAAPVGADGESAEAPASDETADETADGTTPEAEESGEVAVYVRRGRTPTLGFWVAIAIGLPVLAGLVIAPLLGIGDLNGIVNFMLVSGVFVGLPLAAIVCFVDAMRHRTRRPRTPRDAA